MICDNETGITHENVDTFYWVIDQNPLYLTTDTGAVPNDTRTHTAVASCYAVSTSSVLFIYSQQIVELFEPSMNLRPAIKIDKFVLGSQQIAVHYKLMFQIIYFEHTFVVEPQ